MDSSNEKDSIMVTTVDNPVNPFTDFDQWFTTDMHLGHNTCGVLASLSKVSEDLTDALNEEAITNAINIMTSDEFGGIFIKVNKDSYNETGKVLPVP